MEPSASFTSRKIVALCFHIHTNSFSRNSPVLTFMRIARGVHKQLSRSAPSQSVQGTKPALSDLSALPYKITQRWRRQLESVRPTPEPPRDALYFEAIPEYRGAAA